ncbi:somatostatin-1-like [Oncorhynchus mykiss]|uniref:Somatostatin/Cortistatin C-terminal domain-containing protein n=1 Tax=Oncorhynchus mykiss TaxID=8022 RepID=A0A8C7U738_ONCMY|nr:somatostatin-1-like [Oncorhynchus mykiss]
MALTGVLCAFAFVCVTLCQAEKIDSVGGLSDRNLNHQDKLTWLETLQEKRVTTDDKYHLAWLLYKLLKSHSDQFKSNFLPPGPESGGIQESRRETTPQKDKRIRKAGCRMFFWKSWTAC